MVFQLTALVLAIAFAVIGSDFIPLCLMSIIFFVGFLISNQIEKLER